MPSPLVVPVTTISSIAPHPNADSLDVAQVLGWQVVIKRGSFQEADRVVYFPPDTVLTREFSDSIEVTRYLSNQRLKATRLRGVPSFGLVVRPAVDDWQVGDNVAEFYGATKYAPPEREKRAHNSPFIPNPDRQPGNPLFPDYTHINNMRNYPDVFSPDELVVVTEKLHGTNSRIGMIDGKWIAGSHHVIRGEGDQLYWSPRKHAEWFVESLGKHHKQVILYGEIVGSGVQSLDYGCEGYEGYYAFDMMIDGRYVDYRTFQFLCHMYRVEMVPFLCACFFNLETIKEYSKGQSTLADHIREGVVVKPFVERYDQRIGRAILKYVSDDYLLHKHSDFSDI